MSETVLLEKIKSLPEDSKEELYEYLNKLVSKNGVKSKPKGKRGFGSMKGMIEMSDDFDEPLEEFKDYM